MSSLPVDLLEVVADELRELGGAKVQRRAILHCLTVCQDWYPVFRRLLWKDIDLKWLVWENTRPDPTTSSTSDPSNEQSSETQVAEWKSIIDAAAVADAQAKLLRPLATARLQSSLNNRPENGQLVRFLHVQSLGELLLLKLCTQLDRLSIGADDFHLKMSDLGPSRSVPHLSAGANRCLPAWLKLSEPLPLASLTSIRLQNVEAACLLVLIPDSPHLEVISIDGFSAGSAEIWEYFAYKACPPVEELYVDSVDGFSQAFVDKVLAPLASTLIRVRLNGSSASIPPQTSIARPEEAVLWEAWSTLVFPKLLDLRITYTSLAGAAALIAHCPNIEVLQMAYCHPDCDVRPVLLHLPTSLLDLDWQATGPDPQVARYFADCMANRTWLPKLAKLPDFTLSRRLQPDMRESLTRKILASAHHRSMACSDRDVANILRVRYPAATDLA